MKITPLALALLTLVYGATDSDMSGAKGAMTNAAQVQDTLNRLLKSNGAHAGADTITAFITGVDSQIDNAIATVSDALAPLTLGVSKEIGNVLLGPFVQSVTNGAEVLLSNLIGGGADVVDASVVGLLTGNFAKLSALAAKNNVDTSHLQALSREITNTVAGATSSSSSSSSGSKGRRSDGSDVSGLKGAITNLKQTVDTLKEQLETHDGHAGKDVVNAAITGLDSQIDNLAATLSTGLNGATLGISGKIGDFLLGPFFQSVTNGAEVIISNVLGGSVDIVTDGTSKLFSTALSKLVSLGSKLNVSKNDVQNLEKVQKQVENLKAPKKERSTLAAAAATGDASDKHAKNKRASDADMSGANGSMTNYKETQDTLNRQLQAHNGHAAQAVINAFITGADSQIDNAIATVSDALAPLTLGVSKAVGNVLLGPFVQSVTNGAEVLISNLLGGGVDMVSNSAVELYSNALKELSQAATRFGVNDNIRNELVSAQQKLSNLKAPASSAAAAATKAAR